MFGTILGYHRGDGASPPGKPGVARPRRAASNGDDAIPASYSAQRAPPQAEALDPDFCP